MSKSITLIQDAKLDGIFNPSKSSKKSLEDRILAGFLNGRAITLFIDSMPNAKSDCSFELTGEKISKLTIDKNILTTVKKLSLTPFFLRRLYHSIAMAFNIGGYKDTLKLKAKTIADAYTSALGKTLNSTIEVAKEPEDKVKLTEEKLEEKPTEDKPLEKETDPSSHEIDNEVSSKASISEEDSDHSLPEDILSDLEKIAYTAAIDNPSLNLVNYLYNTPAIQNHFGFVLSIVAKHGSALQFVSPKLKNNKEVVLKAVNQNGKALEHASPELKNNKEVVLQAVNQNGNALEHASLELKNDKEVVLQAVNQDGNALEHASPELKNDEDVVRNAVNKDPIAIRFASAAWRANKDLCLEAVKKNGYLIQHLSDELKKDKDLVIASRNDCGWLLFTNLPINLQDDPDVKAAFNIT